MVAREESIEAGLFSLKLSNECTLKRVADELPREMAVRYLSRSRETLLLDPNRNLLPTEISLLFFISIERSLKRSRRLEGKDKGSLDRQTRTRVITASSKCRGGYREYFVIKQK